MPRTLCRLAPVAAELRAAAIAAGALLGVRSRDAGATVIEVRRLRGWVERLKRPIGVRLVEFEGDTPAEVAHACVSLSEAAIMAGSVSVTVERWQTAGRTVASCTAVWELPA